MHHFGIKRTISTLSTNRVMTVHACLVFEEITIRYLEIRNRKCVLQEDLGAMAPAVIVMRMFSQELIVWVFQYFAGDCTIIDYQLQSIKTLARIRSRV